MELANGSRSLAANASADQCDGGTCEYRTGSSPGANAAATGTLLAAIVFPTPAFAAAVNGVKALNATGGVLPAAGGVVGYARLLTSGAAKIADLTVGVTGSGADIELPSTTIVMGVTQSLASGSWTQPA